MSSLNTGQQGRLQSMDSINAEIRLPVPKSVEGDYQPVEIESLMLDMFFNILQNLHGPGIKTTVISLSLPQSVIQAWNVHFLLCFFAGVEFLISAVYEQTLHPWNNACNWSGGEMLHDIKNALQIWCPG